MSNKEIIEEFRNSFGGDAWLGSDRDAIEKFILKSLSQQKKEIEERYEKERWWSKCEGCADGHSSFWKIVLESPQWELWEKEQMKRFKLFVKEKKVKDSIYDMPEVMDCGWISQKHFQDFIKFIK